MTKVSMIPCMIWEELKSKGYPLGEVWSSSKLYLTIKYSMTASVAPLNDQRAYLL